MWAAGILMHEKRPTNFAGVEFSDANVAFAKCSLGRNYCWLAVASAAVFLPYRLLNLSTRPAVSTSFCLPVKNGWQAEQISTCRSPFFVERVWKVSPQAHVTVISVYSGWI